MRAWPVPLLGSQGCEWYQALLRILVRMWQSRVQPSTLEDSGRAVVDPCPLAHREQQQAVAASRETKASRETGWI